MPRLLRQEIEEIPLRHQRDEAALDRKMAHIRNGNLPIGDPRSQGANLVMGPLQERAQQPKLAQQLERGRMDRIPSEIAEEIGMFLEHGDLATGSSEQESSHDSCWSAAGDYDLETPSIVTNVTDSGAFSVTFASHRTR
jgi:hypothetical protein